MRLFVFSFEFMVNSSSCTAWVLHLDLIDLDLQGRFFLTLGSLPFALGDLTGQKNFCSFFQILHTPQADIAPGDALEPGRFRLGLAGYLISPALARADDKGAHEGAGTLAGLNRGADPAFDDANVQVAHRAFVIHSG